MREMKDSGIPWIGMIPTEWSIRQANQVFAATKHPNVGLQVNNLLSLSYGRIVRKSIEASFGLLPESFEGYNIIDKNTIVLRLTDLQNDQKSLRVGIASEKGIITSAYLSLRCITNDVPRYLYYLLHCFDIVKGFYGMGGGIRQGLTWDGVKNLRFFIPNPAKQQRIVDFLDAECSEIDSILENTRSSIEDYRSLKLSVITEAVTKGIRGGRPMCNSGVEWIGMIPSEWHRDKIVRLFRIIGSGTTPKSSDESAFVGNINWIQSGDINGGKLNACKKRINDEVLHSYPALKLYKAPFIIIAMYGASVGNTSYSKIDGCVNQACCVLKDSKLYEQYAFYSIKSLKGFLIYNAVGGGQPNIGQDTIKSSWIPVPPYAEQQEIAAYLDEKCAAIDSLIASKEALISELEAYKKSLIYEYVTGKKEVI